MPQTNKKKSVKVKNIKNVNNIKRNSLLMIALLVCFIFPFAQALSKPITGTIFLGESPFPDQQVQLQVTVRSPIGQATCEAYPFPITGSDGSFSTNLENLVVQGFPSVHCNSFWAIGDPLWYETTLQGTAYRSLSTTIASGTGLQQLSSLKIIPGDSSYGPDETPSLPAGESSGGKSDGGRGRGGGTGARNTLESLENTPNKQGSLLLPEELREPLLLTLRLEKGSEGVRVQAFVNVDGWSSEQNRPLLIIYLLVQSYPEQRIIIPLEENWSPEQPEIIFDIPTAILAAGHYRLQALAYQNGQLLAASSLEELFTEGNTPALPSQKQGAFAGQAIRLPEGINSLPRVAIIASIGSVVGACLLVFFWVFFRRRRDKGLPPLSVPRQHLP